MEQRQLFALIMPRRTPRLASLAVVSVCLIGGLVGCVTKPTTVTETSTRGFGAAPALMRPVLLDESTVILDARPAFEYSMARIPRSLNINWVDFSERDPMSRGWPQKDSFAAARRLARMGISPDSKVVVFGLGPDGQGEEGRVAWLLAYLGVENVQFARFGAVKSRVTTEAIPEMARSDFEDSRALTGGFGSGSRLSETDRSKRAGDEGIGASGGLLGDNQPKESGISAQPVWKPELESSLIATRAEVLGAFENRAVEKAWSFQGAKPKFYRIIDVRSAKEYLGKTGGMRSRAIPNFDAMNIPWKEFFDTDLKPLPEIGERLMSIGFRRDQRILVIDNDGVASAAVTMALRAMGFVDAACYAGGYNDLSLQREF
jgi:3-mercaptopyruvate sulfurtransferase SseA